MKKTLCLIAVMGIVALAAESALAQLVHRYSFTNDVSDSVGGAHGSVEDPGGPTAVYTGGQLDLSANDGETSNGPADDGVITEDAYVDLPNGIISALGDEGSFEMWVTVDVNRSWSEIYSFGAPSSGAADSSGGGDLGYITIIPETGDADSSLQQHHFAPGGPATDVRVADLEPLSPAVEHHLVSVVDKNDLTGGPDGTAYLYLDGAPVGNTGVSANFSLGGITDTNNWLGRSQWNDPLFDGNYNEFRIYDDALSAGRVAENFAAGPDTIVPEPASLLLLGLAAGIGFMVRRRFA